MEVSLQELLAARERRAQRQRELLAQYGVTLVCFTMNIPGPQKYSPLIAAGFQMGCARLEAQLAGLKVVYRLRLPLNTGCEAYYAVDAPAEAVKAITLALEEADGLGRLFDMDVFAADGSRKERSRPRGCLICQKSARECGPARTHSARELWERTQAILREAVVDDLSRAAAANAVKALLWEVATAPKPGLVDRLGSGCHGDMDIFTFMGSAAVLQPYFAQCVRLGAQTADQDPTHTLARLRFPGRQAEADMYRQTGGVNTHKGAIFTLGLMCGAVGRLWQGGCEDPEQVLSQVAAMCAGLTRRELEGLTEQTATTDGQRIYLRCGAGGVRAQAEQGYPAIKYSGLPVLREGLAMGLSPERAGCGALLAMLTANADTNFIKRAGQERARQLTREIALLLSKNRYPDQAQLQQLDALFTAENLSPGGTADLLAATWFLHFLSQ